MASVSRPLSSDFCPLSSDWTLAIAGWDQGGHEAELKRLATELEIPWRDCREAPYTLRGELAAGRMRWISAFQIFSVSAFSFSARCLAPKSRRLRSCDAFILPSFSEGLPMVVLEAWAYGKPVLMTPECNLPEGFAANAAIRIETNPESIARGLSILANYR